METIGSQLCATSWKGTCPLSIRFAPLALVALIGVVACGDTIGEQALSGAVVGAAGTAIIDGNVGNGAVVGAVGGILYCQSLSSQCN